MSPRQRVQHLELMKMGLRLPNAPSSLRENIKQERRWIETLNKSGT
jgi:hypothetical protein